MTVFHYKAVTAEGDVVEGHLEAPDRQVVIDRLLRDGQTPIRADEPGSTTRFRWCAGGWRRQAARTSQLAEFTRQLSTLLGAGLELDRALSVVLELTEDAEWKLLLNRVQTRVRSGASLSEALATIPEVFTPLYVNMVRAGESAGVLSIVTTRLADHLDRSAALRGSVQSALIYPAVLMTVTLLSIAVLVTFVLPRLGAMFHDMGVKLPLSTEVVFAIGAFLSHYWALILGVSGGVFLLARWRFQDPAVREWVDGLLLKVPLISTVVLCFEMARFARTLGTLLDNGVELVSALGIVRSTFSNRALAAAVEPVQQKLKEGRGLSKPLDETALFPLQVVHMLRVGEETGQLGPILCKIADVYDRDLQSAIQRALAVLEPVLILGFGLIVAGVVLSSLVALLSINDLPL